MLMRTDIRSEQVTDAVREHILASRVREFEVRQDLRFGRGCFPAKVGYHQFIELPPNPDDLHIRKNHRNARNRAQKKGVRILRGNSAEDVATFYRLHTLTRRRLGVPVQPRRFFDLLADRLLSEGHGFVATAMLDGAAVASGVYLTHNGTLMAKFGASDPDVQDSGAGYLIDWEMMVTGCREGYHTLDLGRTDADADGLRQYKAGWGALERPLIYTHVSDRAPKATLPHPDGLSTRLIRTSPTWVCRALGEVFYRWAA
jgi:lipid II:glycine glycyltransferase (peptidoglycan interpeptide bridge formation enzyme)